jgi:hypothetical protein
MMGKLGFKTGEYLMMKKLPIKAIYLRRLEAYRIDAKLLKYKDFFPDEGALQHSRLKNRRPSITIRDVVEEYDLPELEDDPKESIHGELDDTNVKSLLDSVGAAKVKGVSDDKSSRSHSTRSEGIYRSFKNRISDTKKQSAAILKKVKIGFLISLIFNVIAYSTLFTILQASVDDYSAGTVTALIL